VDEKVNRDETSEADGKNLEVGIVKFTQGTTIVNNRSERRIPFATVDNTGGEKTVVLGLQQLWSDAKSNWRP